MNLLHVVEVVVLAVLFISVLSVAVGTFLADLSDELPLQQRRVTPEPGCVRLCPFDQDGAA